MEDIIDLKTAKLAKKIGLFKSLEIIDTEVYDMLKYKNLE